MRTPLPRTLVLALLLYGAASLVHFVHNAEFLADYPNLPASWSRTDVYFAWLGMTAVGILGWFLLARGLRVAGLLFIIAYAGLGLDSLGHYVLAPMSAHTGMMNATILMEVTAATMLLIEALKLIGLRSARKERGSDA
jgi:hypothetical protein